MCSGADNCHSTDCVCSGTDNYDPTDCVHVQIIMTPLTVCSGADNYNSTDCVCLGAPTALTVQSVATH